MASTALKETRMLFGRLCLLSNPISSLLGPSVWNALFPNPHEAGSSPSFISQLNVELFTNYPLSRTPPQSLSLTTSGLIPFKALTTSESIVFFVVVCLR